MFICVAIIESRDSDGDSDQEVANHLTADETDFETGGINSNSPRSTTRSTGKLTIRRMTTAPPTTPAPTTTPTTPTTTTGTTTTLPPFEAFQKASLDCHNEKRFMRRARQLKLDEDLSQKAIACAKHIADYEESKWKGEDRKPGQYATVVVEEHFNNSCPTFVEGGWSNMWVGLGYIESELAGEARRKCNAWAETDWGYKWCRPGRWKGTEPFCAMVWKASDKLGLGYYISRNHQVIVYLYSPVGLQGGRDEFHQNVNPYCGPNCGGYTANCEENGIKYSAHYDLRREPDWELNI